MGTMDRKSAYLIWLLVLFGIGTGAWGYHHYFIERDFVVHTTTECDPAAEACFVWCEEGECEEEYYKKIDKSAQLIPLCDVYTEECEALTCEPGEVGCEITLCSSETVEEGEMCTDPADFQEEEESEQEVPEESDDESIETDEETS